MEIRTLSARLPKTRDGGLAALLAVSLWLTEPRQKSQAPPFLLKTGAAFARRRVCGKPEAFRNECGQAAKPTFCAKHFQLEDAALRTSTLVLGGQRHSADGTLTGMIINLLITFERTWWTSIADKR